MEISYRQASRFRGVVVYAFPLDPKSIYHCGDQISPIPPGLSKKERGHARNTQIDQVYHHIFEQCDPLWPGKVNILPGYSKGQHSTVLGLVLATGRNDQLIPGEETMEKLKDIMAANGFKGAPGWFVLAL